MWRPFHKKDIDTLEHLQRRVTKIIPELRDLNYEECLKECGLTTLETRRLRGDQIEGKIYVISVDWISGSTPSHRG